MYKIDIILFICCVMPQGNGLPSGPGGILGAAEGLSYLALFAGFVVLIAQVNNYGFIPNAVPMEGGMCS